jgi:hypothetical protein
VYFFIQLDYLHPYPSLLLAASFLLSALVSVGVVGVVVLGVGDFIGAIWWWWYFFWRFDVVDVLMNFLALCDLAMLPAERGAVR